MPKHTASTIRTLLDDDTLIQTSSYGWMKKGDYAAQRGVARIYASQLADEKVVEGTRHDNNIGFGHNYSKVGSLLGAWLDAGQKDGTMRRKVSGSFPRSPWVHGGKTANGKNVWSKNPAFVKTWAGQSRLAICHKLAHHHAQQLADFANGDKRESVAKVKASERRS